MMKWIHVGEKRIVNYFKDIVELSIGTRLPSIVVVGKRRLLRT